MVVEDLLQVAGMLSEIRSSSIQTILLISPNRQQYDLFRERYSDSRICCADKYSWNLSDKKGWRFDLIFAGNVMMYSPTPALWFENILQCSRLFLVQDLVNRRRSNIPPYLGSDGDAVRYQYRERGVVSEFPNAYDLGALGDRCEAVTAYGVGKNALHFAALFRGALAESSIENRTASLSLLRSTLWFHLTGGGLGRA